MNQKYFHKKWGCSNIIQIVNNSLDYSVCKYTSPFGISNSTVRDWRKNEVYVNSMLSLL